MKHSIFVPAIYIVFMKKDGTFDVSWIYKIAFESVSVMEFIIKIDRMEFLTKHPGSEMCGFFVRSTRKEYPEMLTRSVLRKILCEKHHEQGVSITNHLLKDINEYIYGIKDYEEYRDLLKRLPSY